MKIDTSNPAILNAAAGLLQTICPGLTPENLSEALTAYHTTEPAPLMKPLKYKEVAELLGVHVGTIWRYVNSGKLRKIKINQRFALIDGASFREFMSREKMENTKEEGCVK